MSSGKPTAAAHAASWPGSRFENARSHRHAVFRGKLACADLVAHEPDGLCVRSDKDEARVGDALGERGVLGQKPVARMNRVGAGVPCRFDDLRLIQVRSGGNLRVQWHSRVRQPHVRRGPVLVVIHGDAGDVLCAQRAQDAASDLAAIRNEHAPQHLAAPLRCRRRGVRRPSRRCTARSSLCTEPATVAALSAPARARPL